MELPSGYAHIPLDKVGSTNEEAARYIAAGAARDRTILTAKEQAQGRGRSGRSWISPEGNLYATLILMPEREEVEWPQLCFVVSLAIAEAVKDILAQQRRVQLKWPNDVLVGGRKISGILMETSPQPKGGKCMLIGFGVNCRSHPSETMYPATNLAAEGARQADITPEAVLDLVIRKLEPLYQNWLALGLQNILPEWLALAKNLHEEISIRVSDYLPDGGKITGTFMGIDAETGALLLKEKDGLIHRITHGDVFFPESKT